MILSDKLIFFLLPLTFSKKKRKVNDMQKNDEKPIISILGRW